VGVAQRADHPAHRGDTFAFARRAPGFVADQAERHLAGQPLANIVKPAGRRG